MPKPGASCLFKINMKIFSFVNAAVWHQGQAQTKLVEPYLAFVSSGSMQPSYSTAVKWQTTRAVLIYMICYEIWAAISIQPITQLELRVK